MGCWRQGGDGCLGQDLRMNWYDEIQEAGDRVLREARAALYAERGRLGRERAAAYLAGVRWVVKRLRKTRMQGREGPSVFMLWFSAGLKPYGPQNRVHDGLVIPEELWPTWNRGRNDALRTIDAAKHLTLTRQRPPPGEKSYDYSVHIHPPGFK